MRLKSFAVLLLLFIISCKPGRTVESDLLSYVPENATFIVRINNLNTFRSELKNNHFLSDLKQTTSIQRIKKTFGVLDEIQSDTTSLVALYEDDSTHVLFVGYARPNWLKYTDSTKFNTSFKEGVQNIEIDDLKLYARVIDGKRIASTSEDILETAISNPGKRDADHPLETLYRTTTPQKSASLFINAGKRSTVLPGLLNQGADQSEIKFSDWITYDLNSGQQYLYLNGLARIKDSTHNLLKLFDRTRSLPAVTPDLAPPDADAILVYTFDDYEQFAQNQQQYLNSPYSINTPFNTVEEIGHIYKDDQRALLISAYATEAIGSFLEGISNERNEYKGYDIIRLSDNDFLAKTFDPLARGFKANYYCVLNDKFVFSETTTLLENMVTNRINGNSFKNSPYFESASDNLTNQSNILLVTNRDAMRTSGSSFFSDQFIQDIRNTNTPDYVFSSQLASDNNFFHTHLSVSKLLSRSKSGTTSTLFSLELDSEIYSDPQFVINHRTNQREIVVQDIENNLYLISTEGKVLWKKELSGPIQGKIRQVDIYKNGRLQLAFTTNEQFMILDRNGREVPPFNKSYPGGNLNALAVFDYEKNKDYRFVVTQGPKVFMYNSKGNIVSGFKYTEAQTDILDAPKHIRIGQRDYLIFKLADGTLKILNRVGSDRITLNENIEFSDNEVYLYRNKITLTDKAGTLFGIDSGGKVSKSRLNFNEEHKIDATTKTLATLNENSLTIKGRTRELDLGVHLKPVIFYIYDKIYVSSTDIQNGQVHLFDSSNRNISGFPVFGNSVADLADMDNDGKLELVTKDQDNSLIVYSLR